VHEFLIYDALTEKTPQDYKIITANNFSISQSGRGYGRCSAGICWKFLQNRMNSEIIIIIRINNRPYISAAKRNSNHVVMCRVIQVTNNGF
jgi:hypothetical protein